MKAYPPSAVTKAPVGAKQNHVDDVVYARKPATCSRSTSRRTAGSAPCRSSQARARRATALLHRRDVVQRDARAAHRARFHGRRPLPPRRSRRQAHGRDEKGRVQSSEPVKDSCVPALRHSHLDPWYTRSRRAPESVAHGVHPPPPHGTDGGSDDGGMARDEGGMASGAGPRGRMLERARTEGTGSEGRAPCARRRGAGHECHGHGPGGGHRPERGPRGSAADHPGSAAGEPRRRARHGARYDPLAAPDLERILTGTLYLPPETSGAMRAQIADKGFAVSSAGGVGRSRWVIRRSTCTICRSSSRPT